MSGLIGGDNNKPTADNTGKKSRKTIYIILLIIIVLGIISLVLGLHFTSEDGKFSDWSECTKECGTGIQTRTYTPKVNNGDDLPDKDILKQSCNTQPCPINGSYNNWSEYGTCVKSQTDSTPITCGTGKKSRTRTYNAPLYGGSDHTDYIEGRTDIQNKLIEWENCTHDTVLNCPINGSYSEWITQAGCVKSSTDQTPITCRGAIQGVQKKTRTYNPPLHGGSHHTDYIERRSDLENKLIEWETCTNISRICQPQNASCSPWTNDGNPFCNTDRNTGSKQYQLKQKRTYTPAIDGGTDLTETDDNNLCKTSDGRERTLLERSDANIDLSVGVCPANGIMTAFTTPIDTNCTPATGKNRAQYLVATYTFPTSDSQSHDSNFTALGFSNSQITDIKNLTPQNELTTNVDNIEYIIKRTNNNFPYIYEIKKKVPCLDKHNFSTSQINTAWSQATGCTQPLNTTIYDQIHTTEDNLRYLNSLGNVFDPFTAELLISNKDTEKIKLCYGTDNNTGYVTVNTNNRSNYTARAIFPPGIRIAVKGIFILTNGTYRYRITNNGGCGLVNNPSGATIDSLMEHSYTESNFGHIVMEHGGNLVIFPNNDSRNLLWSSGTGGNPGAYLELESNGSLIIKKKDSSGAVTIIKYLYIPSSIQDSTWTSTTGCTQPLDNALTTLTTSRKALSELNSLTSLANVFNPFTANSLITNKDTDKIKLCYGTNNNTGYVTVTNKNQYIAGSTFRPGIRIAVKDIDIVQNSNYKLSINNNGKLEYVNKSDSSNILFSPIYAESNFGHIVMEHGGNLVIFTNSRNVLWNSDTGLISSNLSNYGAYLELDINGSLYIKKEDGTIFKYLYISPNDLNTAWKSHTGCSQDLSPNVYTNIGTTMSALQRLSYIESNVYPDVAVKPKFDPYKLENITSNYEKFKECYGTTGYVTINGGNKSRYTAGSKLLPGFTFTKNIPGGIDILKSGNHTLNISNTGAINIYGPGTSTIDFYTVGDLNTISMQHDGNLVIYNINGAAIWNSGTSGNSGAYLELESNGSLYIKNSSGTIIKYLNIPSSIQDSTWTSTTGCTQPLDNNILTTLTSNRTALSKLNSLTSLANVFNPFTAISLISNKDTDKIKVCYGSDGYVTVTNKDQYTAGSTFRPGIRIAVKNIDIVQNGTYKYKIDSTGKCGLVNTSNDTTYLMSHNYTSSNFGYLVMQHDGNLVIYSNATPSTKLWESGTGTSGNSGAYLELTTNGSLIIKKSNGDILKYLYIESGIINTAWKEATGCTQDFSLNVQPRIHTTMSDLQKLSYIESEVKPKFDPYKLENITSDYEKFKECYGTTGYVTINGGNKSRYTAGSKLLPGFTFPRNVPDGIVILRSGLHTFSILQDGNLYIYGPGTSTIAFYNGGYLNTISMQHDGNLVIYNINNGVVWQSETAGNPGAYLQLEDTGELYIKKSNGDILKYLRSRIRPHLTSAFYDGSPNTVFSDKKGRFFAFTWPNNGHQIQNNMLYEGNIPNSDCNGYDDFRGWCIDDSNVEWNVKELNLLDFGSYGASKLTDSPNKTDDVGILSDNYNRDYDRVNFYQDGGNQPGRSGVLKRKPLRIRDGVSKSNYLPGYVRVSYVDGTGDVGFSYKFLIMQRGTGKYNQAFVLYQKYHSRDAFADDIIANHPEIIENLKVYYRLN